MKLSSLPFLFASLTIAAFLLFSDPNSSQAQQDLGTLQELLPPSPGANARRSINGRIRVFDNVLIHPMPVWSKYSDGPAPSERSKIQTATRDGIYSMNMTPREETLDNWKSIFTITGVNRAGISIKEHAESVAAQFQSVCSPSNLKFFPGRQTPISVLFVVACGNYSRDREQGHMAAVVVLKTETTVVTISRQWRDKAFQAAIQSAWPVDKDELESVMAELAKSRLIPLRRKGN